jgi:D-3-phosphoglycerate dehydrogenase
MASVLVTDHAWPSIEIEREILARAGATVVLARTGEEAELVELAAGVDAILTCWKTVSPAVLGASSRCRVVARYGVGLDNIAVDVATELGILVTNVPDYCVDEVSEHTIALLLALARRIIPFAAQTRSGGWDNAAAGTLHRVRGQTLGVIGFGRIGRATAAKAHALGMRVVAHTPSLTPDAVADAGFPVEVAPSLRELLAVADVVSLHLPSTPETRGLIGAAELDCMKPAGVLLNTSRGELVDSGALAAALRAGRLGGAGIDVLAQEPPDPAEPLLGLDNVIVTPHAGFFSAESTAELQRRAAGSVAAVLRGELPAEIVNPAVLDHPGLRMAVSA